MEKNFVVGNKVFAKIRGYPPWPAIVQKITHGPSKCKLHVFFYGSYETGVCNIENVHHYMNHKLKYGKPIKRKKFMKALSEIEGKTPLPDFVKSIVSSNKETTAFFPIKRERKRKRKVSNFVQNTKNSVSEVNVTDHIDTRRQSGMRESCESESVGAIVCVNSQENLSTGSSMQIVKFSRSGRKIIPKKFTDEDIYVRKFSNTGKKKFSNSTLQNVDSKNLELSVPNINSTNVCPKSIGHLKVKSTEDAKEHVAPLENDKKAEHPIKWFHVEARLVEIEQMIKVYLSATKKAKTHDTMNLLDQLQDLPITPLMLKKHPHVVSTIKTLRRYVGNAEVWNFTQIEEQQFQEDATQIRNNANHIFTKFMRLLACPKDQCFSDWFVQEVIAFKKITANLTSEEICSLY